MPADGLCDVRFVLVRQVVERMCVSQSVDIILVVWKWNIIIINNNNALMKSFLVA